MMKGCGAAREAGVIVDVVMILAASVNSWRGVILGFGILEWAGSGKGAKHPSQSL